MVSSESRENVKVTPGLDECPKCGDERGFSDVMPNYTEYGEGYSYMEWFCRSCGYSVTTFPLDSK